MSAVATGQARTRLRRGGDELKRFSDAAAPADARRGAALSAIDRLVRRRCRPPGPAPRRPGGECPLAPKSGMPRGW